MNELEEIMNGKHKIKHLKIDNDTLSFNTELDNYDWNLTPRDIEIIIYTLQEDKNNLQSKIDKANEYIEEHTDKLGKIKIPKIDFIRYFEGG